MRWPLDVETKRIYDPAQPDDGDRASKGRVTILYAARDREHNNAVVLAELLRDG